MFLVELRVLHPCNSSNRQWGILTSIPLSVFYNFCHLWSTSSVQRVTSLNVCGIFLKSNCSDQCVILADLNSFCGFIFDYLSCNRENGSQWRSLCFGNLLTWKWWHDHLNCRFLYGIWYIYSWLPHHCCLCDFFTHLSMKFLMSLFCLVGQGCQHHTGRIIYKFNSSTYWPLESKNLAMCPLFTTLTVIPSEYGVALEVLSSLRSRMLLNGILFSVWWLFLRLH